MGERYVSKTSLFEQPLLFSTPIILEISCKIWPKIPRPYRRMTLGRIMRDELIPTSVEVSINPDAMHEATECTPISAKKESSECLTHRTTVGHARA